MAKNIFQLIFAIFIFSYSINATNEPAKEIEQAEVKNNGVDLEQPTGTELTEQPAQPVQPAKKKCQITYRHVIGGACAVIAAAGVLYCLIDGPMQIDAAKSDPRFNDYYYTTPQCYVIRDSNIVRDSQCFGLMGVYNRGVTETLIGSLIGGGAVIGTALYYCMTNCR